MLWDYMARGDGVTSECDKTAYGVEARCSVPPYPLEQKKGFEKETQKLIFDSRNTPIVFKPHENITYDWVDVKKGKNSKTNPQKTGAGQLANHLLRTLLSKHRNRSKGRRERHKVKLRHVLERERKKKLQGTPGQTTNGS